MKKPLLYIPAEKLDKSKYIRQLREIVKWKNTGARGTIIAPTGCGKTIIASIAIAKMVRWYPDYKAVVSSRVHSGTGCPKCGDALHRRPPINHPDYELLVSLVGQVTKSSQRVNLLCAD